MFPPPRPPVFPSGVNPAASGIPLNVPGMIPGMPIPPQLLSNPSASMSIPGAFPGVMPAGFPIGYNPTLVSAAMPIPPFAMSIPRPLTPTGPGVLGAFPVPPAKPVATTAAPPAIDPNNDITCWHDQFTEDGSNRRYWYNSVTLVSTFEKPFCLKSPEERSIPPCPWKEYSTPEGKIYYSDGKEST